MKSVFSKVRMRNTLVLFSNNPSDTFRIGRILGDNLKSGDCVALTGELGTGKTCLTQGIADGLGIPSCYTVSSPTFTLLNEYPGKNLTLYHMDVYRLSSSMDLAEMGYEEYLHGGGVMVIEWAEKIIDQIPEEALVLKLSYLDENGRKIEVSGNPEMMDLLETNIKREGY
jgi:tRNA threonylcarbamoyladenosine biosynthesis protein TsaE